MTPEFSRMVDIRNLPDGVLTLTADTAERAALARRTGVEAITRFEAAVTLVRGGTLIDVTGRITAEVTQMCAISNEPFAVTVDEPLALRFVPDTAPSAAEIELEIDSEASDEIAYHGTQFDLGDELAQSLALAIDPYATGPNADGVREETGLSNRASGGAFAALAALKPN